MASGNPTSGFTDLNFVNNIDGSPLTSATPTNLEPSTSTNPGPSLPSGWLNQAYGGRRSARFVIRGVVSTAASSPGTLALAILLGSTSVATTPAFTPAVSLSNGEWQLEGDLVFRSVGSAGSVQASALLSIANSATSTTAMEQIQCPANTAAASWDTAYDTTVGGTYVPVPFHVQATWGTAPAGDSITCLLLKLWADN